MNDQGEGLSSWVDNNLQGLVKKTFNRQQRGAYSFFMILDSLRRKHGLLLMLWGYTPVLLSHLRESCRAYESVKKRLFCLEAIGFAVGILYTTLEA